MTAKIAKEPREQQAGSGLLPLAPTLPVFGPSPFTLGWSYLLDTSGDWVDNEWAERETLKNDKVKGVLLLITLIITVLTYVQYL